MRTAFALLAAAAVAASVVAADKPALAPGNYRLAYLPRPLTEMNLALVKIADDDGKLAVSTLDAGSQKADVTGLDVSPKGVRFAVDLAGGRAKLTFEGTFDPADPKRVVGSMGDDAKMFPAELTPTDAETLPARPKQPELPAALKDAQKLLAEVTQLRIKASREKDEDAKKKLRDEAAEAAKKADAEVPALYRKVVADHAGTPAATVAAGELLARIGKLTTTPDEAKKWADELVGYAAKYGPRVERPARVKAAEALAGSDELAAVAVPLAEPVAKSDAPVGDRLKAYKVLGTVYEKGGKADLAAAAKSEIDKLELVLDKEYLSKVPPFQPAKFGGRKDAAANRVAVFELFTGTQCPPCVASDVAADALLKAYKPSDVIVLQYHLHVPGPDPLTNPTGLARYEYYQEKFPKDMRGTPSTLVNGQPGGGGGGGMADSQKKFTEFRNLLDPTLEDKADITLDGSAKRAGDEVAATVVVTPGKNVPEEARLKLFLVEENIRYLGGNGVRFHHHVVRAAVGDPAGVAVKDLKDGKHAAAVNLADVRKALGAYLDEAAKDRPFPSPDRPLDLKGLKVVALVQDEAGGEVMQAIELPVVGG